MNSFRFRKSFPGNSAEIAVEPVEISCPYCGETVELLIDCPPGRHDYIEDCQVCCRPMRVRVLATVGEPPDVVVSHEDEII